MTTHLHHIQYDNDEGAFRAFYEEHVFRLFQFAFAFVQNKEVAEEIVNDVFLKLWQQRSGIDRIENMNVYLYVAIRNTATNYLRKAANRKRIDLELLTVSHFYLSPDPAEVMMTDELRKAIERSVNQLPPRCKLIFKLVKDDGLTAMEVATILGLSSKTVSAQLGIALKKLEEALQPALRGYRVRV